MKIKGTEGADWGSRELVDGWHLVEIDKVEDFTNNKQKRSLTINFKVVEGESEGAFTTLYCDWGKEFGEKKLATVIAAIGLEAAFEKAFPGDVSYFDAKVVAKLPEKMKGYQCKIFIETGKAGYQNINKVVNAKMDVEKGETAATPKAKKEAAPAAEKAPGEDW